MSTLIKHGDERRENRSLTLNIPPQKKNRKQKGAGQTEKRALPEGLIESVCVKMLAELRGTTETSGEEHRLLGPVNDEARRQAALLIRRGRDPSASGELETGFKKRSDPEHHVFQHKDV